MFDTSNFKVRRPLLIVKNETFIGMIKDDLGGVVITDLLDYVQKCILT